MLVPCEVCKKPFKKNYDYRRCCSRACAAARRGTKAERFWAKVKELPGLDSCWEWQAERSGRMGYGRMKYMGVRELAHRISWELANGHIPDGQLVLHKCDNPSCVRPDHLFLGTQKQNLADMRAKGRERQVRGAAHGRSKLSEENVRIMLSEAKNGVPLEELALKYGVGYQQVYKIVKGKRWAHLQLG